MKRTKYVDTVTYVDGVKYTVCAPRNPKRSQLTYDPHKSRYTSWHQGVTRFEHGNGKVVGTVNKVN
jgi:hypothetical protein